MKKNCGSSGKLLLDKGTMPRNVLTFCSRDAEGGDWVSFPGTNLVLRPPLDASIRHHGFDDNSFWILIWI